MGKKWTYETTKRGYATLWPKLEIQPAETMHVGKWANKIEAGKRAYEAVADKTGVPWFMIGALHMRESGCDFKGVLHNGEHIIGTGRKTRLVPEGRGPFSSWEEAAIDALKLKGLHKIEDWNVSRIAYHSEEFNGWGYRGHNVNSPYLWASSNFEQRGKYVADHVWDKDFNDPQCGVMTVLKALCQTVPKVARALNNEEMPEKTISTVETTMLAADVQTPIEESSIASMAKVGGGGLTIAGIGSAVWDAIQNASEGTIDLLFKLAQRPPFWIAIGTVVVCGFIYYKRKGMRL